VKIRVLVRYLWKDEKGQDLTEYALLVILVSLGAVASMSSFSSAISKAFSSAAANLTT
jgi:Flp pilus assembly pilin Flp